MVRDARANGLAIAVWGEGEKEVRLALALGLDALGTNYPGRIKALVQGTSGN
jgi:glycerophosphoryl diester phosphodiesterase